MLYPRGRRVEFTEAAGPVMAGARGEVRERRFVRDGDGRRRALYTVTMPRGLLFTCRSVDLKGVAH